MGSRSNQRTSSALERWLPERRLFIRSDRNTRFIRLKPGTQLVAWSGVSLVVGWAIVATAIILMDSIGAGNFRAQAQRDQMIYEDRLNAMSLERDQRALEAQTAQERFASALEQVSIMQTQLLSAEARAAEMETGMGAVQTTLRDMRKERDAARGDLELLQAQLDGGETLNGPASDEMFGTVDLLAAALADVAVERDSLVVDAQRAFEQASAVRQELRTLEDKNDEIFRRLEEAMTVSVEPLNNMFRDAGLDPDHLIEEVRRDYSGTGGPLTPLSISTRGAAETDLNTERANQILDSLDEINIYRIAAERAPFAPPVLDDFRFTSGFGPRWGRMHNGTDFAAPIGTPIYAPGDGVVTFAGWSSGYGRLTKIQHEFGIETRYAHQNQITVEVGQRVSRGEQIGAIGNSGRSTGPHVHYEVRVGGTPVNPMDYIRAGQDVF